MIRLSTILAGILVPITLLSCEQKTESAKKDRFDEVNYFAGKEPTLALGDLKNELATAETDLLRGIKDDPFPWQQWDSEILEKARKAQKPLFLLVGSSLGGETKTVTDHIANTPSIRNLLSENFVCALADTYSHPELGLISFFLSSELQRSTSFPTAIWMSHEGSPVTWIPITGKEERQLNNLIRNYSAMVIEIWEDSSLYTVKNSKRDNEGRQQRHTPLSELEPDELKTQIKTDLTAVDHGRNETFRRYTRQMSSLYSAGDKDLDYIGGLLPTSSLNLLALGIVSDQFTDEVRARCSKAVTEITAELLNGAIKDPLDDCYYYARRTTDWSLPTFTKNITSQARVARLLLRVGTILNDPKITAEGMGVLKNVRTLWLEQKRSMIAPMNDHDEPGLFLIDWPSLKMVVAEKDRDLAIAAFSLKKEGNIPSTVDPLGDYFRLNTLRNRASIAELAKKFGQTPDEIEGRLTKIKADLLAHRMDKGKFLTESVHTLSDLALILRAELVGAMIQAEPAMLSAVVDETRKLLKTHRLEGRGLVRLVHGDSAISARLMDYSLTTLLCLDLYQATLDPIWLKEATNLYGEALIKLDGTDRLPAEVPKEECLIPLRFTHRSMIFSDSSLGLSALASARLAVLTGKEEFIDLRKRIQKELALLAGQSTVNHTDFIAACALGDEDLIAVVQGDRSSAASRALLTVLNSQKHLPFLTVRAESGEAPLADLDMVPARIGEASVSLIRGGKVLGQTSESAALEKLLAKIISGKESSRPAPQEILPSE